MSAECQLKTIQPKTTRMTLPPRLLMTLVASSCGFVVVLLDVTIVNVALPSIGASLGGDAGSVKLQQWVVDAYALAMASLMLSAGALGDRWGAKRIFEWGLVAFAVASALCALAPSVVALVAARGFQGFAAALVLPSSLAIITHACAGDAPLRTRAIGLWSSVGGLISAAGPGIGGVLLLTWSWPAIFWINIPICLFGLAVSRVRVQEGDARSDRPIDVRGNLLAMSLFAALTAALLEAGAHGFGDSLVLTGLAVAGPAGVAFWRSQVRARFPVVPPALLKRPAIGLGLAIGLLTNLAFYGLIFVLSNYFQRGLGYDPFQAGMALLPFVSVMIGNVVSGRLGAARGALSPVRIGLVLTTLAYGYGAVLLTACPSAPYLWLLPALVLMPFGGGLTIPALTSCLLGQVAPDRFGAICAICISARNLGAALGVATLGGLVAGALVLVGAGQAFQWAVLVLGACIILAWHLEEADR